MFATGENKFLWVPDAHILLWGMPGFLLCKIRKEIRLPFPAPFLKGHLPACSPEKRLDQSTPFASKHAKDCRVNGVIAANHCLLRR